jgi:hypothetical protein
VAGYLARLMRCACQSGSLNPGDDYDISWNAPALRFRMLPGQGSAGEQTGSLLQFADSFPTGLIPWKPELPLAIRMA